MNRKITIFGGFVLFILFLLLLGSIYLENRNEEMYNDSLMSNYEYDISIESNSTLQNVTLYLPASVFENESEVGLEMINGDYYNKPSKWNLNLEDTEYGLMFKIETAEIQPVYHSLPVAVPEPEPGSENIEDEVPEEERLIESGEYSEETPVLTPIDFGISVKADHLINTRFPIGNESVLLPKHNLRESKEYPVISLPEHINPEYFDYESLVYAHYETSPDAEVQIFVQMDGRNEWWIYGWQYNDYSDRISVQLSGPQGGWVQAEGKLITGDGVYRE
ncbi:hypothetical protein EQO05_04750 [Methanosarcina sp. MSH10X1]|uniref:hypothetical protein n=1 Tax=Methanosarcina sp. MSH10X1 TaxID=2507075 RepID=UPI000FFB286C|nr:hypothetical protein [Methanosarcina sp. MSH10X1]RXA20446.1 hypothetical protein EQO05_04750 [Methanosarcina sp. MSH10X1]